MIEELIGAFDRGLRTVTGVGGSRDPVPCEAPDAETIELTEVERRRAGALMRVNHTGEVCAQALYEGQALTSRNDDVRRSMLGAAADEEAHLAWCRKRLAELDTRSSVLDPLFYATSCALGAFTGLLGDKVSLGFVAATEDQVCEHIDRHIERLPVNDARSRAILERMREDEARHGVNALSAGGVPFPPGVRRAMTLVSKLMTETTYRI